MEKVTQMPFIMLSLPCKELLFVLSVSGCLFQLHELILSFKIYLPRWKKKILAVQNSFLFSLSFYANQKIKKQKFKTKLI
jgi:hypothetical protein